MTTTGGPTLNIAPAGDDAVVPFEVASLDIRGRALQLGPAVDTILQRHAYPIPVSRVLGEAIVLTALLGTSLKIDGRFILQTQTNGPISTLVVDFRTPGKLRAYASFDEDQVAAAIDVEKASPEELMGTGHLAMTIDQGAHTSRYQGVVALDGGSLEDAAHAYFERSEQIPTRARIAIAESFTRGDDGVAEHAWRAGGLIVQFLPAAGERIAHRDLDPGDAPETSDDPDIEEDDAWVEANALVETVEDAELIDPDVSAERLLFRLFHERGVRVFDAQELSETCQCSQDRIAEMLQQFSDEDRRDMVEDDEIVVTCEYCNTKYHFDAAEIVGDNSSE